MSNHNTIGVNLFSVRSHCSTAEDLDATLRRIAEIGYPTVQVSGVGPIPKETIAEIVRKHGLGVCATHEKLPTLTDETDEAIEKLRVFESTYCALGSPGGEFYRTGGAAELASLLREPAKKFDAAGCKLGYHNHDKEFEKFGAKTFFDEFLEATEDDPINIELDLHWVARGGATPQTVVRRWGHRIGAIHIKDFALDDGKPVFAEVGEGNLDWDEILPACEKHDIRLIIVEQDTPRAARDIFSSLEISFKNMKTMGLIG